VRHYIKTALVIYIYNFEFLERIDCMIQNDKLLFFKMVL
jgi:hypothetical protein